MKIKLNTKNGLHYASIDGETVIFPKLSHALTYIFMIGGKL